MRPTFNVSSHTLSFDSANSSNYMQSGPLVTANGTHTSFIDQAKASRSINVNPFNVINYLGKINLDPSSDIWIDTNKRPDLLVNLEGDKDAWAQIAENSYSYEWGDWQTYWTGTTTTGGEYQGWLGATGTYSLAYGTQTTKIGRAHV